MLELLKGKKKQALSNGKTDNPLHQVFQNQHFPLSFCPLFINSKICAAIVDDDLLCVLEHKCFQLFRNSSKKHVPVSRSYNLASFIPSG